MMQCVVWGELYVGITNILSVKDAPEQCRNHILHRYLIMNLYTAQNPLLFELKANMKVNLEPMSYGNTTVFKLERVTKKLNTKLVSIVSLTVSWWKVFSTFFGWNQMVWSDVRTDSAPCLIDTSENFKQRWSASKAHRNVLKSLLNSWMHPVPQLYVVSGAADMTWNYSNVCISAWCQVTLK